MKLWAWMAGALLPWQVVAATPGASQELPSVSSFWHTLWTAFNDFIGFTANVWQNIDGVVFCGIALYLLIRLSKSVLGHDESTIKTSTSFDYLGFFPRESDPRV